MQDTYQVLVINTEVPLKLGPIAFAHSQIAFIKNGEIVSIFEGSPADRTSGTYSDYSAKLGDSTLRVAGHTGILISNHLHENAIIARNVVFETTDETEFLKKMAAVADAAAYINSQNMDYSGIGVVIQNCNSAAYTLLVAAGLNFPEDTKRLNLPGRTNSHLPANWVAPSQFLDGEDLRSHLRNRLSNLHESEIEEQVRRDPNPYAGEYLSLGEGGKVRFSKFDPKKALPVTTPPLYTSFTPPTRIGSIVLATPELEQLNQVAGLKDLIGRVTAHFMNADNPSNKISPEQAINIVHTHPQMVADFLKEALKKGTLPDELKAETPQAQTYRSAIDLYARALQNAAKNNTSLSADRDPQKSNYLTLSQVLDTSSPIIVQGTATRIASALQTTGQNVEIQKVTENGIGTPSTPQQILAANTIVIQQQKTQANPSLQQNELA